MEAAIVKRKGTGIKKGKLKKTIKNVLCRPDYTIWPTVSQENDQILLSLLDKFKVSLPKFNKPHWNELKLIPKEQRPKQPPPKKIEGLMFGIGACCTILEEEGCSAVLVESTVNPRIIVQPLLDMCVKKNVPVICLNGLRQATLQYFGVRTSCLGIKKNSLPEVSEKIDKLYESIELPTHIKDESNTLEKPRIADPANNTANDSERCPAISPYLYRMNKKTRAFIPSGDIVTPIVKNFVGQDFIDVSDKSEKKLVDRKAYMNMLLKRISSNENRPKRK